MRFNYLHHLILVIATACTALCAHAKEPLYTPEMPEHWQDAEGFNADAPMADQWWTAFDDELLDSLIAVGLDNNYNAAMAMRRIEIARRQLQQTRSAYFPQIDATADWTRMQTSGMTGPSASKAVTASYFDLGLNMSWQIDVFGAVSAQVSQGNAQYMASRAAYEGVMATVAAKIATAYFQLRALQAEIDLLNRHIESQKHIVEITEARHEAGLASMLDVHQARTTYYSTMASLTSMKASETQTINSLALLIGAYPEEIASRLRQPAAMPDYRQLVSVGVPMELLRRRPDVVQAEYELAGYAAALGIAKKDYLPTLSLRGSIGTSAHRAGDLFGKESLGYTIAPTLSWTAFDGFRRKAATAAAQQQLQAGIDNYNLTILTAVQEAENAMAAYTGDVQYIQHLQDVEQEARESFYLSIDLYKQGLTPFINVTNAQITLLQYSNQLVVAKGQALADLATLCEALGGGWNGAFMQ